jgi:polyisoprenoid-binding protein YceI
LRPSSSKALRGPCAALLGAALVGVAQAQSVVYELVPEASFVHFEVLHFGTSTTRGRFGPVRGRVSLDRAAGTGEVGLSISTASVSTGIPVFDARLKREDLLDTEGHPEAFFVASRFRFEGQQLAEVRGEFTLRGMSRPLSLFARRFSCRPDPAGEVCGGDFEAEIKRSEFGATFGAPLVSDRVRLLVQVEGRRESR